MGCLEQSEDDYCDEAVDEDKRTHINLFALKVQKQRNKEQEFFMDNEQPKHSGNTLLITQFIRMMHVSS